MEQTYRAIANIEINIRGMKEDKPTGEIVNDKKLKEYGLTAKRLYRLDGDNLPDLLTSLKQILGQLQQDR